MTLACNFRLKVFIPVGPLGSPALDRWRFIPPVRARKNAPFSLLFRRSRYGHCFCWRLSLSRCHFVICSRPETRTPCRRCVHRAPDTGSAHTYLPCAGRRDMQARGAWEWQPKTRQIEIRCWPIKNNVWKLLLLCFCCLRRPFFICSACMMIFWSRLHTRTHTEQPQGMLDLGGARAGA